MESVSRGFVLAEVDANGKKTPVSEHATFLEGWSAGQNAAHADEGAAFSLYVAGGRRVARFAHNRIATRYSTADVEGAILALS